MIDDEHSDVRFVFVGDSPFPFCHHFASISTNFDPSTLPRFHTLTTLSHSYHAFSLLPRFPTLTTLSHSYHAFSLIPRFLTHTTLSHSCHAFSLPPRSFTLATLTPHFFSSTIYHSFQLLPPLSSLTMVLISLIFRHPFQLPPPPSSSTTVCHFRCPVEVQKLDVLPTTTIC